MSYRLKGSRRSGHNSRRYDQRRKETLKTQLEKVIEHEIFESMSHVLVVTVEFTDKSFKSYKRIENERRIKDRRE